MPIPDHFIPAGRLHILVRKLLLFALLLLFAVPPDGLAQTRTVYKIQVASLPREYTVERIQADLGLDVPVTMHYIGGRFKYFVGSYANREAAQADVATVPVDGAWVVPVQVSGDLVMADADRGDELERPVDTTETRVTAVAKTAEEEAGTGAAQATQTEMVYRVQVAAERRFIDPEQIKTQKGLTGYDVDYQFINGWYKYFTGDFKTREEAEQFRQDVIRQGFVVQAPIDRVVVPEGEELVSDTLAAERPDVQAERAAADSVRVTYASQYARWIQWGDQAFATNNLVEARGYYQQALQYAPNEPYPVAQIAQIEKMLEETKQKKISRQLRVFLFVIVLFTIVLIVALIFTLVLRTRRKRREKKTDELRDEIQDSVTEYLFDEQALRPKNVERIRTTGDKQILIDEIMQLYANLSGEISNRLRELYIDLGLDNESVQKTQSPQWHIRAKGFRELAQMNIKTVNEEIEKCLNSDNDILRMEAQLAMIRLNYEDPFSFLDKLKKPFTSWEQLHVYEMITRHQIAIPDFSQWLGSPNETVVVFAIRMIRAFKQSESVGRLYPFLDHREAELREEAIITLGELRVTESLSVLRDRFTREDQSGKVLILQAMSKMPEEENVDFLQSILEPSNALRLEAAEALSRIESFGVKGIETILRRSDDDLQAVARHILDSKTR